METNIVHHQDCRNGILNIPSNSIDMAFIDPPYKIGGKNMKVRNKVNPYLTVEHTKVFDFGDWDVFESEEAFKKFTQLWFTECARVLKPNGHFLSFLSKERISWFKEFGVTLDIRFRDIIVWHKTNPMPNLRKMDKFVSSTEFLYWGTKGNDSGYWNQEIKQPHNFIEIPLCQGKERYEHPCQKPLSLIKYFVNILSQPEDIILDLFGGTGTVAVACQQMGRKYIIFEKEEQWIRIIYERLKQQSLF